MTGTNNLPNSPDAQEGKDNKPKSILSEISGFLKESLYSLLPKKWSQFLKKIESYFDDPKTETKAETKTETKITHNNEHEHEQVATAPEEPKNLDIGQNMHADKEILAYFGIDESTPKEKIQKTIEKQLISINFLGKNIRIQPVLAEKLKSIEPQLKTAFKKANYRIDTIGSQNWRCISPHRNLPSGQSRKLSNHAFGLAIDIDPRRNPYKKFSPGETIGEIGKHPEIIEIFKSVGLEWGGDWDPDNHGHGQDAMHFQLKIDKNTPNPHQNKINKTTEAKKINSQQQSTNKNTEDISNKKTLLIGETDPNKVSTISIHFHGAPYQITDEEYFARYQKNPPSLKPNQTNLYPANSLTLKSEKFTDYIASAKTKYPNAAIELTAHSFGGQTLLTNNKEAILNLKPSKLTLSDPVIYSENLETLMQLLDNGTEIALSYGNTRSTSQNDIIPKFCQKLKDKYPNSELIMSGREIVGLKSKKPKIYIIENNQTPYKNHEQAKNNIAFLQNELDKSA